MSKARKKDQNLGFSPSFHKQTSREEHPVYIDAFTPCVLLHHMQTSPELNPHSISLHCSKNPVELPSKTLSHSVVNSCPGICHPASILP